MKDFRSLQVWRKSHELTLDVYRVTQGFPGDERFGLASQLRPAAASVPSNIAEGCGRSSDADFARFCQIAMGSSCEVDYQLVLARDLGLLNGEVYDRLFRQVTETQRMLVALLARLRTVSPPTP